MRRPPLIFALLLNSLLLISLCLIAPRMYPILHGNSPDFWSCAAKVNLGAAPESTIGVAIHHNHHWVYLALGMDYSTCYSVSDSEIQPDRSKAEAELSRLALAPPASRSAAGVGFTRWKLLPPPRNTDLDELFNQIDQAWAERIGPSRRTSFVTELRAQTQTIANRADIYWLNFGLEFLYLSALLWFACWPFIRHASTPRKYVHLTLIPLLFYLPLWLSYSAGSQGNFPDGGILYPLLVRALGRPMIFLPIDRQFLALLPPLLAPINQGSTLTIPILATAFGTVGPNLHGPTDILLRTTCFLSLATSLHLLWWLDRKRTSHRPGFPVLQKTSEENC